MRFPFKIKKTRGEPCGRDVRFSVPLLTPTKLAVGLGSRADPTPIWGIRPMINLHNVRFALRGEHLVPPPPQLGG
ncbi:MAG: hypothetical protein AMJ73_06755 [candidate division Zixibacteria bacterium SM1_73]|nr:MAG: hypothetical protein AMJ73_06755 [candidate division Zixibacteria bacterium SM1_73]